MAKERQYTHVEFDQTTCPYEGCVSGKDGGPQTGSVPGIKRHVKLVHGKGNYEKLLNAGKFPALRSKDGPIQSMDKTELWQAAVTRKLIDGTTPAGSFTKTELIKLFVEE